MGAKRKKLFDWVNEKNTAQAEWFIEYIRKNGGQVESVFNQFLVDDRIKRAAGANVTTTEEGGNHYHMHFLGYQMVINASNLDQAICGMRKAVGENPSDLRASQYREIDLKMHNAWKSKVRRRKIEKTRKSHSISMKAHRALIDVAKKNNLSQTKMLEFLIYESVEMYRDLNNSLNIGDGKIPANLLSNIQKERNEKGVFYSEEDANPTRFD